MACSTEGASFLLEAGVVERLAESEGMAKASQIATEATKLGALGVANGGDVSALCWLYVESESMEISLRCDCKFGENEKLFLECCVAVGDKAAVW